MVEVTGDTRIEANGRQASLSDLREGMKVKASYEALDGKNIATRIEILSVAGSDATRSTGSGVEPQSLREKPGPPDR
jgi:hypothetical protein